MGIIINHYKILTYGNLEVVEVNLLIEIKEIRRQDYKKAQKFAIQGMHLDWYMDSKDILDLYAKYFWYIELNHATKVYGAYVDGAFVGVLEFASKAKTL